MIAPGRVTSGFRRQVHHLLCLLHVTGFHGVHVLLVLLGGDALAEADIRVIRAELAVVSDCGLDLVRVVQGEHVGLMVIVLDLVSSVVFVLWTTFNVDTSENTEHLLVDIVELARQLFDALCGKIPHLRRGIDHLIHGVSDLLFHLVVALAV